MIKVDCEFHEFNVDSRFLLLKRFLFLPSKYSKTSIKIKLYFRYVTQNEIILNIWYLI